MPRSDKPISRGKLTDSVAPARGWTWSSHASPEDAEQFEPDGASRVDALTQEPVAAVINLMDPAEPEVTVLPPRPASSRLPSQAAPAAPPVYEWMTVRSIEGRTYMRRDERHRVVTDDS